MGRKSLKKVRKPPSKKTEAWAKLLLPQLQDQELSHLTIDDLARLVGKSKSTLYQYFQTKEDFLTYTLEVRLAYLRAEQAAFGLSQTESTVDFAALVKYLVLIPEGISSQFLAQLKSHYPEIWQLIDRFLEEVLQELEAFYRRGIEQGTFLQVSVDLLLALDHFFISQLITDTHFFIHADKSLEEVVADYLRLRLEGLLGNKENV